jgi:PIN domain nuclease of toxin-antitoxin system
MAADVDSLSKDVQALLDEPDTLLYMSVESVRELIVLYRNKKVSIKRWKSAEEMVRSIEKVFFIKILPLKEEHMHTYSLMEINDMEHHKDPSDHIIIAHALTEHLPLISSDHRFEFYRAQGLELIYNKR